MGIVGMVGKKTAWQFTWVDADEADVEACDVDEGSCDAAEEWKDCCVFSTERAYWKSIRYLEKQYSVYESKYES
jgi:hypothetical protein